MVDQHHSNYLVIFIIKAKDKIPHLSTDCALKEVAVGIFIRSDGVGWGGLPTEFRHPLLKPIDCPLPLSGRLHQIILSHVAFGCQGNQEFDALVWPPGVIQMVGFDDCWKMNQYVKECRMSGLTRNGAQWVHSYPAFHLAEALPSHPSGHQWHTAVFWAEGDPQWAGK